MFRAPILLSSRSRVASSHPLRLATAVLLCGTPWAVCGADEMPAIPNIIVTDNALKVSSRNVIKLPLAERHLPFSAERLDAQDIKQSGYDSLAELLNAASSALNVTSEGGMFSNLILRGFGDTPIYRNGLNDAQNQFFSPDLTNIESIEVLKGPNAALFGPGEPGGAVVYHT